MEHKNESGFTLIEIIIAMAILGLMSLMVMGLYFSQFKVFSRQSAAIDGAANNTIAIDDMETSIKQAERIRVCTNIGSYGPISEPCSGFTSQPPSATQLVLSVWPIDSTQQPITPTTNCDVSGCLWDFIIYYKSGTDLIKRTVTIDSNLATNNSARRPSSCATNICHVDKIIAKNVTKFDQVQYLKADGTPVTGATDLADDTKLIDVVTVVVTFEATVPTVGGPAVTTTTTRKVNLRNKYGV